ncbi:unnamed protein product [Prunus armeniaca]
MSRVRTKRGAREYGQPAILGVFEINSIAEWLYAVKLITLLITLNFKTVDAFEEKVVDLDIEEI